MKANMVWMGHEYAYVEGGYRRSAGNPLPMQAKRCTPLKIYEEIIDLRARTMVRVRFPDRLTDGFGNRTDADVPARHLIDFWDNYEDERNHILELRKEKEREREKYYAEQEALRAERRAKDEKLVKDLAELFGIHAAFIRIEGSRVSIDKGRLQEWLDTSAKTSEHLDAIHLPELH